MDSDATGRIARTTANVMRVAFATITLAMLATACAHAHPPPDVQESQSCGGVFISDDEELWFSSASNGVDAASVALLPGAEGVIAGKPLADDGAYGPRQPTWLVVLVPRGATLRIDGALLATGPAYGRVALHVGMHELLAETSPESSPPRPAKSLKLVLLVREGERRFLEVVLRSGRRLQ